MLNLRTRLPPLNALVAFEAAARHLSFTRAGEELRVSREAVSRQIRTLEGHLGAKLFLRLHRALALTAEGEAFRIVVQDSLEHIARAGAALQRKGRPAKLTVTATIAIATYWLTPRLPKFRARHPEAEIRVVVSDAALAMAADGIDVGLRYGDGKWPGVKAVRLFEVASAPVCAPRYLEQNRPLRTPADLVGHTLLNLDGPPHAREDWIWWLAGMQVPQPASLHILGFDSYANVIQAALDGQGVALGFSGVIDGLLEAGQLLRPMAASLGKGLAVYLVVPSSAPLSPLAREFHDWVLGEAAQQRRWPAAAGA